MKYRHVIKPTRRSDYVELLTKSWRPYWEVTKKDIREMSIKSLRKLYKDVGKLNYLKLGKSYYDPSDETEQTDPFAS